MSGFGNSFGGWPYNADPAQYIQQATSQQPMPGTTPPNFRSQWYQPPNQQSPLRDQLVALFGNALMSQQAFPQIIQSLMQNPAAARSQLGLLSAAPQSYSPDQNFWRINWNNPPSGGSANTSAASGGRPVTGTSPVFYGSGNSSDSGSADGATGAAGAGSSEGGAAGSVGASVGGNTGTAAGTGDPGVGGNPGVDSGTW